MYRLYFWSTYSFYIFRTFLIKYGVVDKLLTTLHNRIVDIEWGVLRQIIIHQSCPTTYTIINISFQRTAVNGAEVALIPAD